MFDKKSSKPKEEQVDLGKLYAKIGQLEVERDYLKKKLEEIGCTGMKKRTDIK